LYFGPHWWPVLLRPAGLDITLPTGAGAVAIDGQSLDTAAGSELRVAVFPGKHKISIKASHLYLSYASVVDVETAFPGLTAVSFKGVNVTADASNEAKAAASKAIKACITATELRPAGCPQAYTSDATLTAVTWTLLYDPMTGASIGLNDKSILQLTGWYLTRLSYASEIKHRQRTIAVGGPFAASLKWDGQALTVSGFDAVSGAPGLHGAAATDDLVLVALKSQMNVCMKLQAAEAPQCPQSISAFYASNFAWHASSDPVQNAAVAWDAAQGFFTVTGNYDLTVDYDSTPLLPTARRGHITIRLQASTSLTCTGTAQRPSSSASSEAATSRLQTLRSIPLSEPIRFAALFGR
jgi:hypothetical protein